MSLAVQTAPPSVETTLRSVSTRRSLGCVRARAVASRGTASGGAERWHKPKLRASARWSRCVSHSASQFGRRRSDSLRFETIQEGAQHPHRHLDLVFKIGLI